MANQSGNNQNQSNNQPQQRPGQGSQQGGQKQTGQGFNRDAGAGQKIDKKSSMEDDT